MPEEVIRRANGNIYSTETLTSMLTDMINNKKAYRTLKQLGVIVCFQQKKSSPTYGIPMASPTTISWQFSNFDKLLEEI